MTDTCRCVGVVDALHYALSDTSPPACPQHDPTPGPTGTPIALNDDAALAAVLHANLTTKETH